jgi:hypothetical protein
VDKQHRRHAYQTGRKHQQQLQADADEELKKINAAVHAHVANPSHAKGIPEEIWALGHSSLWKRNPEEWLTLISERRDQKKATMEKAIAFLKATETIPVVLYDLVRHHFVNHPIYQ